MINHIGNVFGIVPHSSFLCNLPSLIRVSIRLYKYYCWNHSLQPLHVLRCISSLLPLFLLLLQIAHYCLWQYHCCNYSFLPLKVLLLATIITTSTSITIAIVPVPCLYMYRCYKSFINASIYIVAAIKIILASISIVVAYSHHHLYKYRHP